MDAFPYWKHISDDEEDICAVNRAQGIYCLGELGHILCQTDNDCPPTAVDAERKTVVEKYYCELEPEDYSPEDYYDLPLPICVRDFNTHFCLTAEGKEDSACQHLDKCRQECKTNRQGGFCEDCRTQANEGNFLEGNIVEGHVFDCCGPSALDIKEICDGLDFRDANGRSTLLCGVFGDSEPPTLSSSVAGQSNRYLTCVFHPIIIRSRTIHLRHLLPHLMRLHMTHTLCVSCSCYS